MGHAHVEALNLTPSELPAQEEVWQHLTLAGKAKTISVLDVTHRPFLSNKSQTLPQAIRCNDAVPDLVPPCIAL